eukprot:4168811-Pleurochrysis_carterae.AAC.1
MVPRRRRVRVCGCVRVHARACVRRVAARRGAAAVRVRRGAVRVLVRVSGCVRALRRLRACFHVCLCACEACACRRVRLPVSAQVRQLRCARQ